MIRARSSSAGIRAAILLMAAAATPMAAVMMFNRGAPAPDLPPMGRKGKRDRQFPHFNQRRRKPGL